MQFGPKQTTSSVPASKTFVRSRKYSDSDAVSHVGLISPLSDAVSWQKTCTIINGNKHTNAQLMICQQEGYLKEKKKKNSENKAGNICH